MLCLKNNPHNWTKYESKKLQKSQFLKSFMNCEEFKNIVMLIFKIPIFALLHELGKN